MQLASNSSPLVHFYWQQYMTLFQMNFCVMAQGSGGFRPAYMLSDARLERAGRTKKTAKQTAAANGTVTRQMSRL
ncbi:hypothetical protein EJB05_32222, partial [Eragrostis curvula]